MLRVRTRPSRSSPCVRGIALGGGCEIAIASRAASRGDARATSGFVEVGVGLIPAGGGLAYLARRAAEMASAATRTPNP